MSIIKSLLDRLAPPSTEVCEVESDPQFTALVNALSQEITPPAAFVATLEQRLRLANTGSVQSRNERSDTQPHMPYRQVLRGSLVGVSAVILAIVLITAPWRHASRSSSGVVVAAALKTAYSNLLATDYVRYEVEGHSNIGNCGRGFNVPLTPEEQAALVADGSTENIGTVLSCDLGLDAFTERGAYDLVNNRYQALRLNAAEPFFTGPDGFAFPAKTVERVHVNGQLFLRENGGSWRVELTTSLFLPFVLEGRIAIPDGRLDTLSAQYDSVEQLEDTETGGVLVRHYRASRSLPDGLATEVSEIWVGKEDGLPRRVVIQLREPFSLEEHLDLIGLEQQMMDPASEMYEYRDDPIVVRGPRPEERVVQWTYNFSEFDVPVEIETPEIAE